MHARLARNATVNNTWDALLKKMKKKRITVAGQLFLIKICAVETNRTRTLGWRLRTGSFGKFKRLYWQKTTLGVRLLRRPFSSVRYTSVMKASDTLLVYLVFWFMLVLCVRVCVCCNICTGPSCVHVHNHVHSHIYLCFAALSAYIINWMRNDRGFIYGSMVVVLYGHETNSFLSFYFWIYKIWGCCHAIL